MIRGDPCRLVCANENRRRHSRNRVRVSPSTSHACSIRKFHPPVSPPHRQVLHLQNVETNLTLSRGRWSPASGVTAALPMTAATRVFGGGSRTALRASRSYLRKADRKRRST